MDKETLITQIQEVLHGTRGWVSLKKSEAGIKFEEKVKLATNAGLKVEKHGRYGYTAFK